MRSFLVNYMGFSETKADVATNPSSRKTGQRPEKFEKKRKKNVQPADHNEPQPSPVNKEPEREPWEKKLYKRVMMQIHPDRLDLMSKDAKDRRRRIEFEERLQLDSSPEMLLAIAIHLEVDTDLDAVKQRRLLNLYLSSSSNKIKEAQGLIGWSWGESVDAPEFRLGIVKKILSVNNLTAPADETILAALLDYI